MLDLLAYTLIRYAAYAEPGSGRLTCTEYDPKNLNNERSYIKKIVGETFPSIVALHFPFQRSIF